SFLPRLDRFFQIVSKGGAERRVICRVESTSLKSFSAQAVLPGLDVELRVSDRKENTLFRERFGTQPSRGSVVIQDGDASTERADSQVICLFLNRQITDGDGRHASFETHPFLSSVTSKEQSELRADEEQLGVNVILSDGQHRAVGREIALGGRPRLTGVRAL